MSRSLPNPALGQKRWKKSLKRRKRKAARLAPEGEGDSRDKYRSLVLDLFLDGPSRSLRTKQGPRTFVAPETFSISRSAGSCLKFLKGMVEYVRTARRPRLVLDQRGIKYLGLGAESVLGVVLSEIKSELRLISGTYIKGFKPKDKGIQRIMDEVGSVRMLFMEAEEDIRLSFTSRAKVFRHRHRPPDNAAASYNFDPTATAISEFADHLNGSLSIAGRRLSIDGRDRLCHYIAEVLDNVKEHSGLDQWAIVGYADPDADLPTYRCVIFCFGRTIAETFSDLPADAYPRRVVEPYLLAHKGGSLFSKTWREEDLLTLIALQGDISSKSVDDSSDRGQGTVELIDFFQGVSDEGVLLNQSQPTLLGRSNPSARAEMNILSGATRIKFDGRYRMAFREDLNRHVIAFNLYNDLSRKPDPSAVVALDDCRFPGTLITVEIPLSANFLEGVRLHEN